ncbi:MAG: outer membrane protein transport protein [Deltaproteobacteria bacterium]|nr:outer membrane protein transport protein [Deltaproteobacteria bacterium]
MLSRRIAIVVFVLVPIVLGRGNALGGGFAIPPQTAKAASLANAVTAGVDDPSAVYSNPAALTEVEGNQIMVGAIYVNTASGVTNSGRRSVNKHDDDLIPTLFANYHVPGTQFTLGLGSFTPFGLATSYAPGGFTRFAAIRSELRTAYITPAVAWRLSSFLSVGGGVSFVHSSALLSRSIFLGGPEARLRITDTDNGYAYGLGLLVKPHERLKLGLKYRSRVDLNFDTADVKFGTGPVTSTKSKGTQIPLPPVISMGINWQINPAWAVEFAYDFTHWSEFKHLKARFSSPLLGGLIPGFFIPQDWKDTSTLRFGTSYKLQPNLELRGGLGLDETPIPGRTLSPAIPGADWLTLTGGIGYNWQGLTIDLGYMAVFYKTRRVTNNVLEADLALPFTPGRDKYETFQNLVSLHLRYRF